MSPSILTEPEKTIEWRAGYQAGFDAGKAVLKQELKELLSTLKDSNSTSLSATYTVSSYQL